jgi:hypothetical protein
MLNFLAMAVLFMGGDPREAPVNPPVPKPSFVCHGPHHRGILFPPNYLPPPIEPADPGKFKVTIQRRVLVLPRGTAVAYEWSLEYDPASEAEALREIHRLNRMISHLSRMGP